MEQAARFQNGQIKSKSLARCVTSFSDTGIISLVLSSKVESMLQTTAVEERISIMFDVVKKLQKKNTDIFKSDNNKREANKPRLDIYLCSHHDQLAT